MKTSRILTHTIAALLLPASLHAADRFWIDTLGGDFANSSNWSLTGGGVGGATVPVAADVANFTLNNTYTVDFFAGVTNATLDVENGNVTFALGGDTYRLTGAFAVDIGNVPSQTGRLTVSDGVLAVDTNGDNIEVGAVTGSVGFLTVTSDGRIGDGVLRPDLFIGNASTGTLTVNDNGRVDGLSLGVGMAPGVAGTVTVTGPNAVVDMSSPTTLGSSGSGTLNILNGGTMISASTIHLGVNLGADGVATVSGTGSSWTHGVAVLIGNAGDGTLTISSGGFVNSLSTATLGNTATGLGTATVTGAGSRWNLISNQTIGASGTGVLNISNGGSVVAGAAAAVAGGTGSEGRVTVSGIGSEWAVNTTLQVGETGVGDLTVSGGGFVSAQNVFLGTFGLGTGVATVTGAGSTLIVGTGLTVASLGGGTLNVADGAEVYTNNLTVNDPAGAPFGTLNLDGGSIFVGGTFTRTGALNFTDGLLRVAGDFLANPAAAPFTVSGATNADLPVLELIGSGTTPNISTLVVGSSRRGELRLREGRTVSVSSISIGLNAGSSGTVLVESGASISTLGTLAVGGNFAAAGGAGVVAINGGTVDIATLRLHSGGTINLENGLFAVDSLPTLNGTFNWTAGEVRFDAGSTTLGNFLAGKLLGPSKTLHAGQTISTFAGSGVFVDFATAITVDGGFVNVDMLGNLDTLDLRRGIVSAVGTLSNSGTILLGGPLAQIGATNTFNNNGTLRGTGQIFGSLTNAVAGRIEVIAGERLLIDTFSNPTNSGTISVIGGELQLNDPLTNSASTGLISARDAILRTSGVTNNGAFAFSNGTVDFYGDITQNVGGRITISNGGITNFYDDVVIQPGAASVQATALGATISRAVFFGSYNGGLTGGGQAFIEGDHRPGNSPALITFGGNVSYGTFATLEMELGGTARGTQYDALNVAGVIGFNGTMNVPLISGFQPAFGNVFNLFDFGSRTGTFSTVNLPALIPGLTWSQANLYTAGEIQVVLDLALASRTWDGGGVNNAWSTDNNWLTDVEPLNNGAASLIFAGNVRLAPNVDTPWNVAAITFDNTAGAFTISGPQGITLGAGGITNNDTQTQTITAAITLSANETFNAAAGDLDIASIALAGQTLTFTGINDVTLATASGSGTINKNNTGDLDFTGALGTGGVVLNANAGDTDIGASQTLSALNIANGATVTLGAIAPPPPFAPVPEPGIGALLLSALGFLGFRRASSRR